MSKQKFYCRESQYHEGQFLSKKDFSTVTRCAPIPSIDFIITNNGKYLVGKRKNKPCKGYYFVPGGRIRKGENRETAIRRISMDELGCLLTKHKIQFLDIYDHFYKDYFNGNSHGTHYIPQAFVKQLSNTDICIDRFKQQHEEMKWMSKEELLNSNQVHQYTKKYILDSVRIQ